VQEVCRTRRRGHESKQCGTITPESTGGVERSRLHAIIYGERTLLVNTIH
jgi:hypothetical protein